MPTPEPIAANANDWTSTAGEANSSERVPRPIVATAPNTYAKRTSCISGWMVENTISPGLRDTLRRLRSARSGMSASAARSSMVARPTSVVRRAMSGPPSTATKAGLGGIGTFLLGHMAGEAEEHVVEGGATQAEVGDGHAGGI